MEIRNVHGQHETQPMTQLADAMVLFASVHQPLFGFNPMIRSASSARCTLLSNLSLVVLVLSFLPHNLVQSCPIISRSAFAVRFSLLKVASSTSVATSAFDTTDNKVFFLCRIDALQIQSLYFPPFVSTRLFLSCRSCSVLCFTRASYTLGRRSCLPQFGNFATTCSLDNVSCKDAMTAVDTTPF